MLNRKSQQVMASAIYVFMVMIVLYFAYKLLSPMIPSFLAGNDSSTQVLIILIIPAIFFFFLIYVFKTFKRGEGE